MAINFPSTPTDGQTVEVGGKTYRYSSVTSTWKVAVPTSSTDISDLTDTNGLLGSGGATVYADMTALVNATGMSNGDFALVGSLNKLYVYYDAWFLVSNLTNSPPSTITGNAATYMLEQDGTPTVITLSSTDPEGFDITWSYAVTNGTLGSTATVTQNDNVFTITPSTTEADAGDFTITFTADDGVNQVTTTSDFSLLFVPAGGVLFTTVGSHTWTVPANVTSITAVCVGGGGAGGGGASTYSGSGGNGGNLAYATSIPVTPGQNLDIIVGAGGIGGSGTGGDGGTSSIYYNGTNWLLAYGGRGGTASGTSARSTAANSLISSGLYKSGGGTGGTGGSSSNSGGYASPGGGAGAGGYSGDGGNGGSWGTAGGAGSGGAGGGSGSSPGSVGGPGGGGVGVFGEGTSGAAVGNNIGGQGGSGGTNGARTSNGSQSDSLEGDLGGSYGGGGGSATADTFMIDNGYTNSAQTGGAGGPGAVRIVWGTNRAFPTTNVDLASSTAGETTV